MLLIILAAAGMCNISESHSDEEMFIKEVQKVTGVMTYAAPKMIKI